MTIDRSKSREEVAEENKKNEDIELYKKGEAVGDVLAGTGLASLGLERYSKYISKKPGARPRPEQAAKVLKKGGIFLTAAGVPIAGYSYYKHYKLKNKDKKKDDDNKA